jgi:hypothetical protein
MKHSEFRANFWFVVIVLFLLAILGHAAYSQEAKAELTPALSPQIQVELLKAQHEKDVIAKQKSDLGAQLAQIQNQASAQYAQLAEKEKAAAAKFEEVKARAMTGIDPKKWELDTETMQPKAVTPVEAKKFDPPKK